MKCPKCPTPDELESLIYALCNREFDYSLEEQAKRAEEKKKKLIEKGFLPRVAQAIFGLNESEKEDYNLMREWGNSRSKAGYNFCIHFNSPCETCQKNYAEFVSDYVVTRVDEEGLEDVGDEKMQELLKEAHLHYLGNPEIEKLGLKYGLDNILTGEN